MPDGSAHILLHIYRTQEDYRSRLVFVGPRSTHIFTDRKHRIVSLLVRLKPGSSFLPLPFPFCESKDRAFLLEELLSVNLSEAQEEFIGLARKGLINELIIRFDRLMLLLLNRRVEQNRRLQEAVRLIDEAAGQLSIRSLSSTLGVSDRHLRSLFNKTIGLSPKRYSRIVRLTETVKAVDRGFEDGWAQLAIASGYYDQSHMIEDFHALVGESTEAFISRPNREEVFIPSSVFFQYLVRGVSLPCIICDFDTLYPLDYERFTVSIHCFTDNGPNNRFCTRSDSYQII